MRFTRTRGVLVVLTAIAWCAAGCGDPDTTAPPPQSAAAESSPPVAASAGPGVLAVAGNGSESYSLRDASGNHITSVKTGTDRELAAGKYFVVLGNRAEVNVRAGETTRFAMGVLAVSGKGGESWSLRDAAGNHVTSVQSGREKELVPGDYEVVLGNRAKVAVKAGEKTPLALGVLAVAGTGKESWSLRDASGNHVTSVQSGKEKELVPGEYAVVLGNRAKVAVKGGETTSFALGVLVVGAGGGGSFSLADEAGNHVTTVEAGAERELVPGRYTVRAGEKKHAVEVTAGKTTTLTP